MAELYDMRDFVGCLYYLLIALSCAHFREGMLSGYFNNPLHGSGIREIATNGILT